jgi:CspA family cold shock protein
MQTQTLFGCSFGTSPAACAPPVSARLGIVLICFSLFGLAACFLRSTSSAHVLRFQEAEMPQGTIKKLVSDRGFGFIKGEKDDLFFHNSEVRGGGFDSLSEGQTVDYQIGQGQKGPCATAVEPV